MTDYMATALRTPIAGIEAAHWIEFFKVFADANDLQQVEENLRRMVRRHPPTDDAGTAEQVIATPDAAKAVRLLNGG